MRVLLVLAAALVLVVGCGDGANCLELPECAHEHEVVGRNIGEHQQANPARLRGRHGLLARSANGRLRGHGLVLLVLRATREANQRECKQRGGQIPARAHAASVWQR